jgi:hypothetical protein
LKAIGRNENCGEVKKLWTKTTAERGKAAMPKPQTHSHRGGGGKRLKPRKLNQTGRIEWLKTKQTAGRREGKGVP